MSNVRRHKLYFLRATKKILDRLPTEPATGQRGSTTALGDWYANLIFSKPQQVVLCMSERTLLPVVVAAKDLPRLSARLCSALELLLESIGVPASVSSTELGRMQEHEFAMTNSKSTIASMNGLIRDLKWSLKFCAERSLLEHALYVASFPRQAIGFALPSEATLSALQAAAAAGVPRVT